MPKIPEKLTNLSLFVGNTPALSITAEVNGQIYEIVAKYEAWNFSGSIKDRMALYIIESAYRLGRLKPGDTIVEATSGNTGIAFAAMGAFLGHPVQIYMPQWLSTERKRLLKFYGAKLIEISAEQGGFQECIRLSALKSAKKGYFAPKQFENSWNVLAHYSTTAPELAQSLQDHNFQKLDVFVAGVGTGGTIMGFQHYFSEKNPDFVAHPILPSKNKDGEHRIEGIGDSFIPKILDLEALSPIIRIRDAEAINVARQLNKKGLSVGISSGANVLGALRQASKLGTGKVIGTVLCDDNKKYLSTDLCSETIEVLGDEIKILDYKTLS
jgi:cysteine synthase A